MGQFNERFRKNNKHITLIRCVYGIIINQEQ